MKLDLITLATIKSQLGICDNSYDDSIAIWIPIVSNDVRRILNCNFDSYITATITSGSDEMTAWGGTYTTSHNYYKSSYTMGQVIYSPAFPDDTYIEVYDPDSGKYTLNQAATSDGTYFYKTIQISQWSTISKMVFYKISKVSTDAASEKSLSQISYGNVSKTFSEKEINKKFDYPQFLIEDLGKGFAKIG